MANDTSRTIDIPAAQGKIVALLVLSALSTVFSAALAFGLVPDLPPSAVNEGVGRTALVVFGLSTAIALWRLYATRQPPVTLSPAGILDRRVASNVIPWRAVKGITTWQVLRQQVQGLQVGFPALFYACRDYWEAHRGSG
jgi:hypothetical protein